MRRLLSACVVMCFAMPCAEVSAQPTLTVEGAQTEYAIRTLERVLTAPAGWNPERPEWSEHTTVTDCRLTTDVTYSERKGDIRLVVSFNLGDLEIDGPWLNYPEHSVIWSLDAGREVKTTIFLSNASAQAQADHLKRTGTDCTDNICVSNYSNGATDIILRGYDLLPPLHEVYEAMLHLSKVCKGKS